MGRKPKQGIDYFPMDVDMFQDRKIKRLLRSTGGKGFTIYIHLLTYVYRDKGYFFEWDEHSAFDISDELNFSENVVEETIKACCSIGLFNEVLFSERSIISSESIQQRWQKIVIDANRVDTDIDPELEIIEGKPGFIREKIKKPTEETPKKSGETPQSKVKESKEKKSKAIHTPPGKNEVVKYFQENDFPKELADKFYRYYNEPMEDRNGRVWKDQNGNTVKSWKQKAIGVWMTDKNKTQHNGQTKKASKFTPGGVDVKAINDDVDELFRQRDAADSVTQEPPNSN